MNILKSYNRFVLLFLSLCGALCASVDVNLEVLRFTKLSSGQFLYERGNLVPQGFFASLNSVYSYSGSTPGFPDSPDAIDKISGETVVTRAKWNESTALHEYFYRSEESFVVLGVEYVIVGYKGSPSNPYPFKCVNASARSGVSPGKPLIIGFVVTGNNKKKVLIRAAGPSLAEFGVAIPCLDPKVLLFKGSTMVSSNEDWSTSSSNASDVEGAASRGGAFPFARGSKDAAFFIELDEGAYTVHGAGASGEVLVEAYFVD